MIHGTRSGLLDLGLGRYIILLPKWHLAVEGRSGYFWCQNGALLWRADLSLEKLIFAPKQCLTEEVGSCGLYYKQVTIVIYDHNDSGQYYKTTITIVIDDPSLS